MKSIFRYIAAVIGGFAVGSIVNLIIISMSATVIPPPAGADVTTMEGLEAAMPLFEPKHFIFPFLAHALGTLAGAFAAAKFSKKNKMRVAMVIGVLFLLGGLTTILTLPSPMWYNATDLLLAYFPMAYLGGWLATRNRREVRLSDEAEGNTI